MTAGSITPHRSAAAILAQCCCLKRRSALAGSGAVSVATAPASRPDAGSPADSREASSAPGSEARRRRSDTSRLEPATTASRRTVSGESRSWCASRRARSIPDACSRRFSRPRSGSGVVASQPRISGSSWCMTRAPRPRPRVSLDDRGPRPLDLGEPHGGHAGLQLLGLEALGGLEAGLGEGLEQRPEVDPLVDLPDPSLLHRQRPVEALQRRAVRAPSPYGVPSGRRPYGAVLRRSSRNPSTRARRVLARGSDGTTWLCCSCTICTACSTLRRNR